MKFRILKKFDMFGKQILLRLNGVDRHKTTCGGLTTILIFFTMFIQIISIFQTLILRLNPEVIYNQEYVPDVQVFELDSDIFEFAIGMEDSNFHHFIDESVYYLQATQTISIKNNQTNQANYQYQNVTLERCTDKNFQNPSTQEYFYRQPYKDLYCISRNQKGLKIGGDFDLSYFAEIQINIYKCVGSHCKNISDPQYYQQYFKQPKFAMYFTDVLVDPSNKQPIKPIGRDLYFTTSQSLKQEITVFMIKNEISSEEGVITSKQIHHDGVGFSQYQQQSLIAEEDDSLIFSISLRLEKKKQNKWQRKYLTLSQGISQIGGIYQALVALGCLLLFPISQFELNRKLMNQIFSFENSAHNEENKKQKDQKKNSIQLNKGTDVQKNVVKEVRSQVFNNQVLKELNGTIQLFSQNSIRNQKASKKQKSQANFDGLSMNSPKKKATLGQEFLKSPQQKETENGIEIQDLKLYTLKIDNDQINQNQSLFDKEFNSCQQYSIQQKTQQQTNQINTTQYNNNTQSPESKLIKLQITNNSVIDKSSIQQRLKNPNQFEQRQKQKKSQTYFLSHQPINSLFATQKQNLQLNQQSSLNRIKQFIPSVMTDQSNSKQTVNNNSQNPQSPLSKKEIKEQKKQDKQLKTILKDINRQFQNFFKVTANRIKITFYEYLRYFICPPKTLQIKKKQMGFGAKMLYHHLDIVYILKKLTEIDKLKMLLLDEQQIKLFEYLPRPKIYIEENQNIENQDNIKKFNFLYEDNRTEIERAKDAYESFQQITRQNYIQTQQDKKLLKIIDPHLLELFEEQIREESDDDIIQQEQKYYSQQKLSQKMTLNSPRENNYLQINQIKPNINDVFISQNNQIDTHSTTQAVKNDFKDETIEESSYNQSSNIESLKENLQNIELKMQSFQRKKFSIGNHSQTDF